VCRCPGDGGPGGIRGDGAEGDEGLQQEGVPLVGGPTVRKGVAQGGQVDGGIGGREDPPWGQGRARGRGAERGGSLGERKNRIA